MKNIVSSYSGFIVFIFLLWFGVACNPVATEPGAAIEEAALAQPDESETQSENNAAADPEPTPTIAGVTVIDSGTVAPPEETLFLPDMGPAPEIENEIWLNSEPLRLADLQGQVVMVEFWTFGCINCKRVIPYMNEWQARYAGEDFVIISVHYPEFGFEENIDNVREAVQEEGIEYAVAIDNDGLTWRAYRQRYWPTRYLIDKNGNIRYKHIGEGAYQETAAVIEQLIAESDT